MYRKPFFIVGCGRSGTTLLKSIVSAHPQVFVMPETFFFKNAKSIVARYRSGDAKCSPVWWLADAGITSEGIQHYVQARLGAGSSEQGAVFGAIFDFHADSNKGRMIGEKTPSHVFHIDDIRACFPDARIIQIIRDPRAVYASFRRVKVGSQAIAEVTSEWCNSEQVLRKWVGASGYMSLRYEDLVSAPAVEIGRVCAFLDVPYSEAMLDFHRRNDRGYSVEQDHHSNTRKPIFANSVEGWKSQLSQREVSLIEWALRDGMERNGYQPIGRQPAIPRVRMKLSRLGGSFNRYFVRVPRQRMKALKALRRMSAGPTK